jgi:hypothetical protein
VRVAELVQLLREYQAVHGPNAPVTSQGREVVGLRLAHTLISSNQLPIIVIQLKEPHEPHEPHEPQLDALPAADPTQL